MRKSRRKQPIKNSLVLREILCDNGIPVTPLRILCLRSVMQFKAPFTVQQLLTTLRWQVRISPSIARRTLTLYSRAGLVSKIETDPETDAMLTKSKQRQRNLNYQWMGKSHFHITANENTTPENHECSPNPTSL